MATIQQAVAHQTGGIGYNADAWKMSRLAPGMRLYKMMPADGPYFFNYEGYRQFGRDPGSLYSGLQMRMSERYAMRVVVVEFTVQSGVKVPSCQCDANLQYGDGGAKQYFIDKKQQEQHLYQSSPGWGLDGKGIGYF